MVLAAALMAGYANVFMLLALWLVQLSFVNSGQLFYGYGWETQLLELTFLTCFLVPVFDPRLKRATAPPPRIVIWALRWMLFRLMLGAGLIKIRNDSCWRDLTCLIYHYETQPIPNPLSFFYHHVPPTFHYAGCLFNHFRRAGRAVRIFWPGRGAPLGRPDHDRVSVHLDFERQPGVAQLGHARDVHSLLRRRVFDAAGSGNALLRGAAVEILAGENGCAVVLHRGPGVAQHFARLEPRRRRAGDEHVVQPMAPGQQLRRVWQRGAGAVRHRHRSHGRARNHRAHDGVPTSSRPRRGT